MSQNMQQYPHIGTGLPFLPDAGGFDSLAQVETLKIVACSICRAVYVPSGTQPERYPGVLLETAFLDICHFCFRCQRPACPQCWNPVHHTCASCCEAAHLPFRGPVPALEGLVFLSLTSQTNKISFICQRNGRFYTPEPASPDPVAPGVFASPHAPSNEPVTSDGLPVLELNKVVPVPAPNNPYPTWLQEVLGQRTDDPPAVVQISPEPAVRTSSTIAPLDEASLPWSQTDQTNWPLEASSASHGLPTLAIQPFPPALPVPTSETEGEAAPSLGEETGEEISLFERVENALIVITSVLLLAVVLMIVLSICCAQVNAFFLALIHIDIRTEIAYLLQLR